MSLAFSILLLAGVAALYFLVIRPRGAHMFKTYKENEGGWAGIRAVLIGFQTFLTALTGAIATALPDVLSVATGIDFKALLPEPWGLYVGTTVAFIIPILRGYSATPSGQPPTGAA